MKKSNKDKTEMEKLTRNYEKFMKGKELKEDGKEQFDKTIKKAAKATKQRGSK